MRFRCARPSRSRWARVRRWWRAWGGYNLVASGASVSQPIRSFSGVSPKASLEWRPAADWSVRLSAGQAWRFPTVGELYQAVTVGTLLDQSQSQSPVPSGRARSNWPIERRGDKGSVRLSLFNEVIANALISQTGTVERHRRQAATFVQNVDETRARGVELAVDQRDILPGVDVPAASPTPDAITSRNTRLPGLRSASCCPPCRTGRAARCSAGGRSSGCRSPAPRGSPAATGRRSTIATIYGNTWQGFARYFVVDVRARCTS